jgi:hypothetical protein
MYVCMYVCILHDDVNFGCYWRIFPWLFKKFVKHSSNLQLKSRCYYSVTVLWVLSVKAAIVEKLTFHCFCETLYLIKRHYKDDYNVSVSLFQPKSETSSQYWP